MQYLPLIKKKLGVRMVNYSPCSVLVGKTGVGKTTLYNNLCGTRHKSGAGRGSITTGLFRNAVCVGNHPFDLMDTPGTDSSTNTYKHAVLLREALTSTKINTIFVVITYDTRFERMTTTYLEQPTDIYGEKVVVMVSHLDESKNPKEDFKEICEAFAEDCPEVSNIIFFSEKGSPSMVANLMFDCISNMEREKIEISDEQFHLKFNIYMMKGAINKSFVEYQKQAERIQSEFFTFVKNIISTENEDKDNICHMSIVEFKNEIENLLEDFQRKHCSDMVALEFYTLFIKMQKENVKICDDFVAFVVPFMSYNLFDNQDPRNLIKMCPYCGLVWFKVEGCDGETTCGNRASNIFDTCAKAFINCVIKRINGKLKYHKNSFGPRKPVVNSVVTNNGSVVTTYGSVGCGRSITWRNIPPLEEKLILELYKVKTMEEAKALIKSDKFHNHRDEYVANIDMTIRK